VTCIHSLEHIQGLSTPHLTDDKSVWSHPESIPDQISGMYRTLTLNIGWFSFHPYDVFLFQLQFSRVFDRNDPFMTRNETG
jgi:hypothetical protein